MTGASQRQHLILAAVAFLLLMALILGSGLLLTAAGLLGITTLVVSLWGRYALERLDYRRTFSQSRCFVGDQLELTIEVTNRKVLPVTHLTVDNEVPDELQVASRSLSFRRVGKGTLRLLFGLAWYQKVIRRYRVTPARRGFFRLGSVMLQAGDPFGYIRQTRTQEDPATLVVYPKTVALESLGIDSQRPFGDLRSRNCLFEDPMRSAGVRDYQPGDPLNRIHWKASASASKLQVRLLDPSAAAGLAVFLNTWSYDQFWLGADGTAFEAGCVIAASIVQWSALEGIPVGLFANGLVNEWGMSLRLEPASGPEVLSRSLEGLARLEPISRSALSELLANEIPRLSYGSGVVVITRLLGVDLAGAVLDVRRSGRPVTLVFTGPELPDLSGISGCRFYHVPGEEALHATALA